jgi:hypothetical protein
MAMLGSKCCCKGTKPCNSSTVSGGDGITINKYTMPEYSGQVVFRYEAYSLKDRFTVYNTYNESEIYFDTVKEVSGGETIEFFKPYGVTSVTVRVDGGGPTTEWNYFIGCPERPVNCLRSCDRDTNGDVTLAPIKSIAVTLEAEDYEISIPRFGWQYRKVVWTDVPSNRLAQRVGDFSRWHTLPLDAEWNENPVMENIGNIFGVYFVRPMEEEWGGDPIEVVYNSKIYFPLGMLNGTFELEYDEEQNLFVYDFDECEYECPKYDGNSYYSGADGFSTKLIFSPKTCELYVANFKHYVSINAGDIGGCDDSEYNPYFPDLLEFKFKSVFTNFSLGSWGGGVTFPTVACETYTEGNLLTNTIGINQDIYYDVHPFCSIKNYGFSKWFWGGCGSFDPDDSNRLGLFADEDYIITMPTYSGGTPARDFPYKQEEVKVNVGKRLISDFPVRDCRWELNGLTWEVAVMDFLYHTFLGCSVDWEWYHVPTGTIGMDDYIYRANDLGFTYPSFYATPPEQEARVPWQAPRLPAFWYYELKQEIFPYTGPPIDWPDLDWIDGIKTENNLVITGNTYQNTIITKGKNNLILRRVDVEFEDPQQEL